MQHIDHSDLEAERALQAGRLAAQAWSQQQIAYRLGVVRRARQLLASRATAVAATVSHRPVRDTLVSEVLPLLDAMRFWRDAPKHSWLRRNCAAEDHYGYSGFPQKFGASRSVSY